MQCLSKKFTNGNGTYPVNHLVTIVWLIGAGFNRLLRGLFLFGLYRSIGGQIKTAKEAHVIS